MFENLDYKKWCLENRINELFGISEDNLGSPGQKIEKTVYESVDPENKTPFPAELDDLTRLHFLVRTRKATTILEFGVGKSTVVFADALKKNKEEFGEFVKNNLRRENPFQVYSVDNIEDWIEKCKKEMPDNLAEFTHFHFSEVRMAEFNGRICTLYDNLLNICPDLIYLDAPDQASVSGNIRGISTNSADRLPMSADILALEHFLLPGTLIVVDGRTANARFLKCNLQRNWEYNHFAQEDIHTFELVEPPLGKLNEKQIRFCLGDKYFKEGRDEK